MGKYYYINKAISSDFAVGPSAPLIIHSPHLGRWGCLYWLRSFKTNGKIDTEVEHEGIGKITTLSRCAGENESTDRCNYWHLHSRQQRG